MSDNPKRPVGRPSDYRPQYAEQARKLCLLGLIDAELAEFFGVSEQTINAWKHANPEFLDAIQKGKLLADADVAGKLYHRAMGYEHEDVDIRVIDSQVVMTPVTKYYPPDTGAAIFWLKNRQRGKWRDKVENEITGSEGGPIRLELEFVKAPPREDEPA
jgi:hypothetical protein